MRDSNLRTKIEELEAELKECGIWQKKTPMWINHFDEANDFEKIDFVQWLQFIFIPNNIRRNEQGKYVNRTSIVPQAIKYFENDLQRGKILQILIEIDSIV